MVRKVRDTAAYGQGKKLRKLRVAKGLTQRQLAEKAETHQVQVARFEKGLGGARSTALARVRKVLGA